MSYAKNQNKTALSQNVGKNNRLNFITVAYGIGAALVVLGHSHPLGSNAFANHGIARLINNFIYKFHMPLFFFIAGFLLIKSNSVQKRGYGKFAGQKVL